MKQTRPAPSAAGAAAVQQAEKEGLTLATSANKSGYKGVFNNPKEHGSNKFTLQVRDGGKLVNLGRFATPEQAALFYARRRAGRDTTDLTAPPPPAPPPAPTSAASGKGGPRPGHQLQQQQRLQGREPSAAGSSSSAPESVPAKPGAEL